jgi:integration host factor subunit alpha
VKRNNLKKLEISKNLSKKMGFSILFSKKVIDDLLNVLILSIKENNLNLKNLGVFKIIKKKERLGRNPKTKENYKISARKALSFKASKKIINSISSK